MKVTFSFQWTKIDSTTWIINFIFCFFWFLNSKTFPTASSWFNFRFGSNVFDWKTWTTWMPMTSIQQKTENNVFSRSMRMKISIIVHLPSSAMFTVLKLFLVLFFSHAISLVLKALSLRSPPEAISQSKRSIVVPFHFTFLHQYSWIANKNSMIKDDEICVFK